VQAWEDALPANLVTDGNSQVGQCFNDSEFTSASTVVTISGETTDATHTITLTTGTGQSFRDNVNAQTNVLKYNASNGVGIRFTGNSGRTIIVGAQYVTLDGLQIGANNGCVSLNAANTMIKNCILEGGQAATGGYGASTLLLTSGSPSVLNTLVITRQPGFDGIIVNNGVTPLFVNVTSVKPSDLTADKTAFRIDYGGATLKNCAGFGFNAFSSGSESGSNNCSDKAISFGTSNQASKTYANQFQNTADATRDFRLKTGADCVDNGVTDTTDIPSADDIVKTSRPQGSAWDIGAWELVQTVAAPQKRYPFASTTGFRLGI